MVLGRQSLEGYEQKAREELQVARGEREVLRDEVLRQISGRGKEATKKILSISRKNRGKYRECALRPAKGEDGVHCGHYRVRVVRVESTRVRHCGEQHVRYDCLARRRELQSETERITDTLY